VAKRSIIEVDEDKCNGCGLCIPNCPEGALQIIDGKVRLVSDLFCDGLGACVGHCPQGAIKVVKKEAKPYRETETMKNIVKHGPNTIKAHLKHLKEHGKEKLFSEAIAFLKKKKIPVPNVEKQPMLHQGCPGARVMDFSGAIKSSNKSKQAPQSEQESSLRQWPVQLHLVQPTAPFFIGKDVVIAADCIAYALGNFHFYLKEKSLAIACPKLDEGQEEYIEKITAMIDNAKVDTITVMTMEVPCCGGLLEIVKRGAEHAKRKIPIKSLVVGIQGNILQEGLV